MTNNYTLQQTLLHDLSERFEKPGRLFHFFAGRDHQIEELFDIGLCCDHAESYANKTILAFTCNGQNSILISLNNSTFDKALKGLREYLGVKQCDLEDFFIYKYH
jgi:hypothetical protein